MAPKVTAAGMVGLVAALLLGQSAGFVAPPSAPRALGNSGGSMAGLQAVSSGDASRTRSLSRRTFAGDRRSSLSAVSMSVEKKDAYKVGIVGATGAVGEEILGCLDKCGFPVSDIALFSSARSAGKVKSTFKGDVTIQEFALEEARSCDFVFLAVDGSFALEYAQQICEGDGPVVIDNSSAWRMDDSVPLCVPEINIDKCEGKKLIANPNCTTSIALMALAPLHKEFGIKKCIISTYQAASGAGAPGMQELIDETKNFVVDGTAPSNKIFAHPLPLNVIPHIDVFQDNMYTKEEMKVTWESRKIMNEPELAVSCTSVRIPTLRAHSEAITIETDKEADADKAREVLEQAPGVKVVDDPLKNVYPMPLTATGSFDVEVGRIRPSVVFGDHGLDLFVCGDQLLRGAALNAVLIAKELVQ